MILDLLMILADIIAFVIAFAIFMFGVCGILFAIAGLIRDLLDCEEEEEEE